MAKTLYQLGATFTATEETAGALIDKPWYLVEPSATVPGEAKLVATSGNEYGVIFETEPSISEDHAGTAIASEVTLVSLNAVGVIKVKTSGAISYLDSVKSAAGGTAVAATTGNAAFGKYYGADASSGDIIEVHIDKHTAA